MKDEPSPAEEYLSAAGAREKSGSRVDYDSLLTIGIATVLSAPIGSVSRAYALMDLQDLLIPNQDEEFQDAWGRLNSDYLKDGGEDGVDAKKPMIEYSRKAKAPEKPNPDNGPAFQREWFRLLMNQISKKGLLGRPDFSEDESF